VIYFSSKVLVEGRQNLEGVLSPKSRYLRAINAQNNAGLVCQHCSLKTCLYFGRILYLVPWSLVQAIHSNCTSLL
jgi:hypothetical protein